MLKLIIVEDEPRLASSLKQVLERNPRYRVTAVTDDLAGTLAALAAERPDVALIDLQLANASSGFAVAARLHDAGVLCLFVTGSAPSFPLPDLAIGCLTKPFTEADLLCALVEAEDILRGREKLVLRRTLPARLELYGGARAAQAGPTWTLAAPDRTSWRARILRRIRSPSGFRSAL
jgi:CheY-like chemotaxis protein